MDIESHSSPHLSEVIDATKRGPQCVQGSPCWRQTIEPTGSEDCLPLDVLVPKAPISAILPVLVQIHGGGYDQGNSSRSPGYLLVNQSAGSLIYVAIQYRLAASGFLGSSEVRENGAANAGLLDQRAALGWVQRKIRSFGGDPAKVAIIGGSAGGGSVTDQIIMYGGAIKSSLPRCYCGVPMWQSYKTPHWPQYSSVGADGFTIMDVNHTMIGAISDMDANGRCDFFHGQSYVVRN